MATYKALGVESLPAEYVKYWETTGCNLLGAKPPLARCNPDCAAVRSGNVNTERPEAPSAGAARQRLCTGHHCGSACISCTVPDQTGTVDALCCIRALPSAVHRAGQYRICSCASSRLRHWYLSSWPFSCTKFRVCCCKSSNHVDNVPKADYLCAMPSLLPTS